MKRPSDKATPTKSGQAPRRRGAFTITELLIVVAMIIVLLSMLIVAVNAANRTSQRANTRFLMNSLKQALVSFKDDVGYYPPVLDDDRNLMEAPPPTPPSDYESEVQNWFSRTSLADYLIGYGPEKEDGYGRLNDQTQPAPGIRHPGPDGVWMATVNGNGSLGSRNLGSGESFGKVYGPYL
ncbi:MAG: type II secretion system protein, partial [Planctomycetes bacterium]|nr:type II secretion system protein [Planctomycetota bacterium]